MIRKGYHDVDEFYPEDRVMTSEERWNKLRKYVENEVPILDEKPSVILDFLAGYGNALQDILNEMAELEKK